MMDPPPKKLATGPVSAILYAIHALGCTVQLDKPNLRILITPTTGPPIDLLHASRTAVSNAIRKWTRHTVLGELAAQVNCQTPRRKDMVGITAAVDVRTTQSTLRAKTSPIDNLPLRLFNQLLLSVLAGSIRAGDRIAHADNTAKDACIHCGVRHTTHHLLWECNQGQRARQPYLDKMNRIQAIAEKNGQRTGRHIADLLRNTCFRHTGITNANQDAINWATARPTASSSEESCNEDQEIHWCDGATEVTTGEKHRLGVFTDGSAIATASDWLAHGGGACI